MRKRERVVYLLVIAVLVSICAVQTMRANRTPALDWPTIQQSGQRPTSQVMGPFMSAVATRAASMEHAKKEQEDPRAAGMTDVVVRMPLFLDGDNTQIEYVRGSGDHWCEIAIYGTTVAIGGTNTLNKAYNNVDFMMGLPYPGVYQNSVIRLMIPTRDLQRLQQAAYDSMVTKRTVALGPDPRCPVN